MFDSNKIEFSFPYNIQVSKRAKRLNLKISAEKGVQVIVPPRTNQKDALHFLKENIAWIEKNVHIWQDYEATPKLPRHINFPALQQTWTIEYMTNAITKRPQLIERPKATLIYFGLDDTSLKQQRLRQWCDNKASQFLRQRLQIISESSQLPFNKLSFRRQRTL